MSVSQSLDSNDFFNFEISQFKKFLKDLLLKIIVNIFIWLIIFIHMKLIFL